MVKHNISGFTGKLDTRYNNFTAPVLFRALPDLSTLNDLKNLKLTEEVGISSLTHKYFKEYKIINILFKFRNYLPA